MAHVEPPRLPDWPRLMPEPYAAAYVGVSVSTFRNKVQSGHMPAPVRVTQGRKVWDKKALDRFADGLSEDRDEWAELKCEKTGSQNT